MNRNACLILFLVLAISENISGQQQDCYNAMTSLANRFPSLQTAAVNPWTLSNIQNACQQPSNSALYDVDTSRSFIYSITFDSSWGAENTAYSVNTTALSLGLTQMAGGWIINGNAAPSATFIQAILSSLTPLVPITFNAPYMPTNSVYWPKSNVTQMTLNAVPGIFFTISSANNLTSLANLDAITTSVGQIFNATTTFSALTTLTTDIGDIPSNLYKAPQLATLGLRVTTASFSTSVSSPLQNYSYPSLQFYGRNSSVSTTLNFSTIDMTSTYNLSFSNYLTVEVENTTYFCGSKNKLSRLVIDHSQIVSSLGNTTEYFCMLNSTFLIDLEWTPTKLTDSGTVPYVNNLLPCAPNLEIAKVPAVFVENYQARACSYSKLAVFQVTNYFHNGQIADAAFDFYSNAAINVTLSNTNMTGTIPTSLYLNNSLLSLDLSNNPNLTGVLPAALIAQGNGGSLMSIDLRNTSIDLCSGGNPNFTSAWATRTCHIEGLVGNCICSTNWYQYCSHTACPPTATPQGTSPPVNIPSPIPISTPTPVPAPNPVSIPVSAPATIPAPVSVTIPVPVPIPAPVPVPVMIPTPTPTPIATPIPVPVPESIPIAYPIIEPFTIPIEVPHQVPQSTPYSVPIAEPIANPEPYLVPTPIQTTTPCIGTQPSQNFFCIGGAWTSNTSIVAPIIIVNTTTPIIIDGNLTITTTLQFNGINGSLEVSECILNVSQIVVNLTQTDLQNLQNGGVLSQVLLHQNGSTCNNSVASVPVSVSIPSDACVKVNHDTSSSSSFSLIVLWSVQSTRCASSFGLPIAWWSILIIVVGVILLIATILMLTFFNRKIRKIFFPFVDRSYHIEENPHSTQ